MRGFSFRETEIPSGPDPAVLLTPILNSFQQFISLPGPTIMGSNSCGPSSRWVQRRNVKIRWRIGVHPKAQTCADVNKSTSTNRVWVHSYIAIKMLCSRFTHTKSHCLQDQAPHKRRVRRHAHQRQESLSSCGVCAGRRVAVTEQPASKQMCDCFWAAV